MHSETIEDLQAIEAECLQKFRARAKKLAAANPQMSRENVFCRAVEAMPRTAGRYQHARALLQLSGIRALPLFD
jgi:CBS-domain-containing membrane protein